MLGRGDGAGHCVALTVAQTVMRTWLDDVVSPRCDLADAVWLRLPGNAMSHPAAMSSPAALLKIH
jgi:hypothetical protein